MTSGDYQQHVANAYHGTAALQQCWPLLLTLMLTLLLLLGHHCTEASQHHANSALHSVVADPQARGHVQ